MAAFQRPFDPARVTITTVQAGLPDRLQDTGFTQYARYPRLTIRFLVAQPAAPATTIALSWPASGGLRLVDLPPAEAASLGVSQVIELSPFPFAIAPVLRALGPGLPTFYLGFTGAAMPDQDSAVRVSDAPLTVNRAVIGCMFQDRMTLEPWAWIDLIGNALSQVSPADAAAWQSLAPLYEGRRTIQVRDPVGQPAANQSFQLRFINASGDTVRQTTTTSDAAGDLGPTSVPQTGERVQISWDAVPLPNDEALPVLAMYEPALADPTSDAARSFPGSDSPLMAATVGHLQILDLARWYAPALASPGKPWPARFRPYSHVEPLIDGIPAYTRLVEDIRRASGVHLAGWAFVDFPMRPYDPTSSLGNLLESVGRDKFRILVTKSFQAKVGALDGAGAASLAALLIILLAAEPLIASGRAGAYNGWGLLVWHAAAIAILAAEIATNPNPAVEDFLRNKAEFTEESMRQLLYDVSGGKPNCAFPAPHPAALADNPISHDFAIPGLGNLSDVQALWGVFHQKMQVVALPSGAGTTYVGYLGGIDINSNRVDAPGHHAALPRKPDSTQPPIPAPYHDVHARVTGPAMLDLVGLFQERYDFALNATPANVVPDPLYQPPAVPPPPAFPVPTELPAATGQHLVRIAQTSFKPAVGATGFPWAPNGDAPIRETFERAINSAREYIYIEDQYFTLDNGLISLLRQAADRCRRLVITVPFGTPDQLFGDERRLATFERLSGATGGPGGWGDRMVVGTPFRRPVLPPAERTASIGRGSLIEDIASATASKIYVGPVARVPASAPYFFWVAGELMYATKARPVTSPGGQPSMELEVLRGSFQGTQPPWCPHPRTHKKGAPVTFSAPRDIFVHAKLLMVDDMFVAIGSSNWNRRGFYHDGEADAFAIPDRLKAARDNPAFLLRTALWAEHLGLTPFMGRSLLADPVEAFELFKRTLYQGNRFCHYREFLAPRGDLSALNDFEIFQLIPDSIKVTLIATANAFLLTEIKNLWNTLTDATTGVDPNPTEGPELP
jgi:phosphatidylserine/phosphatidylglycerophosphate/cardiolipin synthase-like enzyme